MKSQRKEKVRERGARWVGYRSHRHVEAYAARRERARIQKERDAKMTNHERTAT